jgi:carbon-monoxide dehydrogenase medium subunit
LRSEETDAWPIYVSPRPTALHEQNWEAAADLRRLGFDFIQRDPEGGFRIGALTSLQDIVAAPDLQQYAGGLLPRATRLAAHLGLRNTANLGGVLTTAEGAPEVRLALMVLEAETVSADGFVTQVRLPAQTLLTSLQRVARTPLDEPIVAVAVGLQAGDGVVARARCAVSGIGQNPMQVETAEAILQSQALTSELIDKVAASVMDSADPSYCDYRGSAEYRREMAGILARRAVVAAWQAGSTT